MGVSRRIRGLEERFAAKPVRGPSEPARHLRAILDELAALRRGCFGGDLLELAVSAAVEAGKVPSERADAYLELVRGMLGRGDLRGR